MFKKNDLILIGVVIILAVGVILFVNMNKVAGSKVRITIDGEEYKTLSLQEDTTIVVEGENGESNTLTIKDGKVDMIDANCPDKLCVKEREIEYKHETITCLPNRVVLEIVDGEENDVDIIAR